MNYDLDTLDKFGSEPARPATSITRTENGWTIIRCGYLEIVVPTDLDDGGDERVEVCNTVSRRRLWVEIDGDNRDNLYVSPIESY